jgi:hypothetical protein
VEFLKRIWIFTRLSPDYALENLLRAETSSKQNALPLFLLRHSGYYASVKKGITPNIWGYTIFAKKKHGYRQTIFRKDFSSRIS